MVLVVFGLLFSLYGYNDTWRLWNIPVMSQHFADLRTITHGAESYAQGLDPMIENPGDPWHRKMNYPRIWQSLYYLGINSTHTTLIGIMIIFSFLVGVCAILPNASNKIIAMVFAAVLSPATLLGVERGNIDLLMFFFAALSVLAIQRSYILSAAAIMTGFLLKLFPVFSVAVLLKAGKQKFILCMFAIMALSLLYICVSSDDLLLIRNATPQSTTQSYGMNVLWMRLNTYGENLGLYAKILSYISVCLVFVASMMASIFCKVPSLVSGDNRYLDSFRVGASIYIGTFLLGNNWDYRLMFLIFVIPQLILWAERPVNRFTVASRLVLVSIYASLWYLVISKLIKRLPYGDYGSYMLDETFNWIAFSGLTYLLFSSLPAWVMEFTRKALRLSSKKVT